MQEKKRPSREELFAFYFLGFDPEGNYRFSNAWRVGQYYRVSADGVMRWLEEMDLEPKKFLLRKYDLAAAQVDLQLEAEELMPEEIQERAAAILAEAEGAETGRKPWEENG